MLEDAQAQLSNEAFQAFHKVYEFSKEHADQINLGTGAQASFSPIFNSLSNKSLFSLYVSPTYSFGLNFEWIAKSGREDTATLLKEKLESIGFSIPGDYMNRRPSLNTDEWVPKVDEILEALRGMLKSEQVNSRG